LGGGVLGNGKGRIADKVIKIPSKRGPQALRTILNDYELHVKRGESFLNYYDRQGEIYFYRLLKPLADATNLQKSDFVDWGSETPYIREVGIGECAGVVIDLVATLLFESEEKIENASEAFKLDQYSDSIYYAYTSIVNTAKALLLTEGKKTNTQAGIITQFEEVFENKIQLETSFPEFVYQIKNKLPSKTFAQKYVNDAKLFYKKVDLFRTKSLTDES
jgi:sulfite reductase (ferredoxin)